MWVEIMKEGSTKKLQSVTFFPNFNADISDKYFGKSS